LHDNFFGKFEKIWAKILCTPNNLLAPTPTVYVKRSTIGQQRLGTLALLRIESNLLKKLT